MRLLFVYGFSPSGHASAAKALEAQARAQGHETSCVDLSADYHQILGPAINSIYLALIQSFPNLWTAVHDNESAAGILSQWRQIYHLFAGDRLRESVAALKPDRIICTHAAPFAGLALAKEKGELKAKLIGVVTDFQAHPYWAVPGADLYVTATQAAARTLAERGIAAERVLAAGIPVHPVFAAPADRAGERRALGLRGHETAVLITGGSRGLGRVGEAAEALLRRLPKAKVIAVCGSNEELRAKLEKAAAPGLTLFGAVPIERMRALMAAADIMVGKAGGLTTSECLAVGLPLIVLDPIAGQEQRNAEFLTEAGAALIAEDPEDVPRVLEPLLKRGTMDRYRAAARALARPDAGREIIDAVEAC
jgi:processive 1,2-diacylglycerol beta-glucosyltransferase